MPNYRKSGYEDFSAELQGARVKRLLRMKEKKNAGMNGGWTSVRIATLIGVQQPAASKKLNDDLSFSKKEIELIAKESGIAFDTLYVYNNKVRLKRRNAQTPVQLDQVTADPKLLNHFLGVQVDSKTRDTAVRHLVKLEKFISDNKEKIRKRRNKERELRHRKEMLKFILRKLHEETGVWPHELQRIKKVHGNFLQFQERFDELKLSFTMSTKH